MCISYNFDLYDSKLRHHICLIVYFFQTQMRTHSVCFLCVFHLISRVSKHENYKVVAISQISLRSLSHREKAFKRLSKRNAKIISPKCGLN